MCNKVSSCPTINIKTTSSLQHIKIIESSCKLICHTGRLCESLLQLFQIICDPSQSWLTARTKPNPTKFAHPLGSHLDSPPALIHALLRPLHGQGAVPVLVIPTSNATTLRLWLRPNVPTQTPLSSNSSSPKSALVAMTTTNPRTSLSRNLANSSLINLRSTPTPALALTYQLVVMTQENFFSKTELISPPSSQ